MEHHGGEMLSLPHPNGSCCSSVSGSVSWCALMVVTICSGVVISLKMASAWSWSSSAACGGDGLLCVCLIVMILRCTL